MQSPSQRGANFIVDDEVLLQLLTNLSLIQMNKRSKIVLELKLLYRFLTSTRWLAGEISPVLQRSCRYVPTCSEYSMIAYKRYGFAKGSALTVWRLCRCNPIGGSGFDPPRWFGEDRPREE